MAKPSTQSIVVNGTRHAITSSGDTPLLYVLRDELGLTGPKFGCGLAQCGACSVLIGGQSTRSCVLPVIAVTTPVTTLEGLGTPERPHPLQQAFIDEQALQCGYCTPGLMLSALQLLSQNKQPSEKEMRKAIAGNTCRCTGYQNILKAIQLAAQTMKGA